MKKNYIPFLFCLLFNLACHAQPIMKTVQDAPLLIAKKDSFINKPLSLLLNEIKPPIKAFYGDPESASSYELGAITFIFVEKKEFLNQKKNKKDPIRLLVQLKPENNKTYPKPDMTKGWSKELTKTYGDMIVVRLSVLGKD